MATRSRIGILEADGMVTSVYCHWDGYPEHNGKILTQFYTTEVMVRLLMDMGDLSVLAPKIGSRTHRSMSAEDQTCVFQGRDRGEREFAATLTTRTEFLEGSAGEEFFYLYDPAQARWLCYKGSEPYAADGMFRIDASQTDVQRLTEYVKGLRSYGFYELHVPDAACDMTFAFKSKKDLIAALPKIDDLSHATVQGRMFYTQKDF